VNDTPTVTVDATGLRCPVPVARLAEAMRTVEIGSRVALLATDPSSRVDVPVWCRLHRHRLTAIEDDGAGWRYLVVRAH
jgi:tRNA 2-thiouridine synthesizing protein A